MDTVEGVRNADATLHASVHSILYTHLGVLKKHVGEVDVRDHTHERARHGRHTHTSLHKMDTPHTRVCMLRERVHFWT